MQAHGKLDSWSETQFIAGKRVVSCCCKENAERLARILKPHWAFESPCTQNTFL